MLGVTNLQSDRPALLLAGSALALVLLAGVAASFLGAQSRGQADKLTAEVAALGAQFQTGPVAEQLARAQTVERQVSTLTTFQRDALDWPAVLDSLSGLVPAGTKLTTINVDGQRTLRLEGESGAQQDVATLLAALDAAPDFAEPRLDSLSLNESADGSVVLFSIASRYAPASATPPQSTQAPPATSPDTTSPDAAGVTP